jgi:hypothetical protein
VVLKVLVQGQVFEGSFLEGRKEDLRVGVSLEKLEKRFDANLKSKQKQI